jgi:hypothetical protein
MDGLAARARSFTNEALFSRDLLMCREQITWIAMHPAELCVHDHDIVHRRGVHGAPPLPLRWIFADTKPRSALSRASVFLLIQFVPKPRHAQGTPRASASTAIARRWASFWFGGPSKHLRNQPNPTQDHQANHREVRSERWFLL